MLEKGIGCGREGMRNPVWVFFAAQAKPSSMRRVIPERLAENEPVIIIEQAVSLVRERLYLMLKERCRPLDREGKSCCYRPMHFPEGLTGVGSIFKRLNEKLMQREIDRLLPAQMDRIVCYDSPTQYPLVRKFRERLSVYLAVDDRTLAVSGDLIYGEKEAESRLLEKVDLVVCVSEPLAQTLKSRTPQGRTPTLFIMPNGYDERIFDPSMDYPEPRFLRDVPRPRILITGHVSERIDWDGVAGALKARPSWTWVFVGPADPGIPKKIVRISGQTAYRNNGEERPRIVWHDAVPLGEVPALIGHCDAAAVPYRLNAFTRASSPLKAVEYLAMGVPVISTRVPSLEQYGEAIQWVEERDGESYARGLDKMMLERDDAGKRAARRAAVVNESWAIKMNHFRKMVLMAIF